MSFKGADVKRPYQLLAAPAWVPPPASIECPPGTVAPAYPVSVHAANGVTCVIMSNGRVRCVGDHSYHQSGKHAPKAFWRSTLHQPSVAKMPLGTSPASLGDIDLVPAAESDGL